MFMSRNKLYHCIILYVNEKTYLGYPPLLPLLLLISLPLPFLDISCKQSIQLTFHLTSADFFFLTLSFSTFLCHFFFLGFSDTLNKLEMKRYQTNFSVTDIDTFIIIRVLPEPDFKSGNPALFR